MREVCGACFELKDLGKSIVINKVLVESVNDFGFMISMYIAIKNNVAQKKYGLPDEILVSFDPIAFDEETLEQNTASGVCIGMMFKIIEIYNDIGTTVVEESDEVSDPQKLGEKVFFTNELKEVLSAYATSYFYQKLGIPISKPLFLRISDLEYSGGTVEENELRTMMYLLYRNSKEFEKSCEKIRGSEIVVRSKRI